MASPYRKKMATIHCELCPSTQVLPTESHLLLVSMSTAHPGHPALPLRSSSSSKFFLPLHFPASCCCSNTPNIPPCLPHPPAQSQGLCIDVPLPKVLSLRVISPPHSQCKPVFQCEPFPRCQYSSSPSISQLVWGIPSPFYVGSTAIDSL